MTVILVVVDLFSKYAMFIPMQKFSFAEETTRTVFKQLVKYWGVLKSIIRSKEKEADLHTFKQKIEEFQVNQSTRTLTD
ncbi:Uncharacterized protein TCM_002698 [Theobroma cacao]|uniref:Integrase catalytic domain-containing protein n=1 Tax=Theobroma cacao TaxID=3641 RepID=A0A061DMY8_THECC|nr:Uncharacterized protein TCM_002698 [Theobroma cacao]